MNWNELKKFCASSSESRDQLKNPVIHEGKAYATNGHIVMCVPIDGLDVPANFENDPWWTGVRLDVVLKESQKEPSEWFEVLNIPNRKQDEDCYKCGGSGQYDCQDCGHEGDCPECEGFGQVEVLEWAKIKGVCFLLKYLTMVKNLPGLKFGLFPDEPLKAHRFKFDGGYGCIMPCKKDAGKELEVTN